MTQCMYQREYGRCGKKTDTGQDDDIRFHCDKQGIVDSFPGSLKRSHGEKCMSGVSKGEKKPQEEDKAVHYKEPAYELFEV